jgi:TRAP-type C4-dicarboxylate transport system, small permease component
MKTVEKIADRMVGIEYWFVVPVFSVMLVIMFVQVVFRYFLQMPLSWSEELARFMFVAATFLGASIATAERGHIEINFTEMTIVKFAKTEAGRIKAGIAMNVLRDAGTIICLALVGWQTLSLVLDQFQMGSSSTAMGFPFWIITGIMLLGLFCSMIHSVLLIILNLSGRGPMGYEFMEGEDVSCSS